MIDALPITLTFTYTDDDFLQGYRLMNDSRSYRPLILGVVAIFGTCLVFQAEMMSLFVKWLLFLLLDAGIFYFGYILYCTWTFETRMTKMLAQTPGLRDERTVICTEDSITFRSAKRDTRTDWRLLSFPRENQAVLAFRFGGSYFVLPKRCLSDETELLHLRALIERRVGTINAGKVGRPTMPPPPV